MGKTGVTGGAGRARGGGEAGSVVQMRESVVAGGAGANGETWVTGEVAEAMAVAGGATARGSGAAPGAARGSGGLGGSGAARTVAGVDGSAPGAADVGCAAGRTGTGDNVTVKSRTASSAVGGGGV